ncbi:hypothetical protein ACFYXC_08505 [Streptomyces sp. NPDC002701]|uniref:hypothetical protein n=1 Tax=Streptomyces sp. NPDC002701 TaxID=3364661 RepID=UPI00367DFEE9
MPADEVHYADSAGESRARTGPRHAAPRKPLFTRLHVPAGKAIAIASMPTAILMGMGFTPTLAQADDKPSAKNLTIDEYKDCVEALDDSKTDADGSEEDATASPTPTPSASADAPSSGDGDQDSPDGNPSGGGSAGDGSTGDGSSSDSGSEDEPAPAPAPSTSAPAGSGGGASTPAPTPSQSDGNVLDEIGDALEDILTPGGKESATPTAEPSATAGPSATKSASEEAKDPKDSKDTGEDTAGKPEDGSDGEDSAEDGSDAATEPAAEATEKAEDEATASPTPSPSASATTDPDDCPAATDEEGGVETGIPALADDPWLLEASSLTLKGADYQGIVKVKTANGSVKEVLKYVISNGTDIGDLHQMVDDKDAGVRYHVQAGSGTTSTIDDGKTVMYTESISGNLLGLIPITFDPKHPPPLNIPLIYFTKVKVVQAAQFGGTLTVPGMHQYNTPLG